MFTLIRSIPIRHLSMEQLPVVGASLLITELFYEFGSFTLECVAFFSTWDVLNAGVNLASRWCQSFIPEGSALT